MNTHKYEERSSESRSMLTSLILFTLIVSGCKSPYRIEREPMSSGERPPAQGGEPAVGGGISGAVQSVKPALKVKDYRQLEADLSASLELSPDELCKELNIYSCLQQVHRISLGGISPDQQSIYTPSELSSVSAPILALIHI